MLICYFHEHYFEEHLHDCCKTLLFFFIIISFFLLSFIFSEHWRLSLAKICWTSTHFIQWLGYQICIKLWDFISRPYPNSIGVLTKPLLKFEHGEGVTLYTKLWSVMTDPCLNSLAPGRCGYYLKLIIFKLASRINVLSVSCEIVLRWMPEDLTNDKSTLVQVMAWCRQATSHYLNQCWPGSISPYGVTRPQN